jgi:predicted O-linked N-acetylglucosamine transferase (SPINDLY family)
MALSLPPPPPPSPASAVQQRAYRQWSSAQASAQREHWAQAALGFEQAFATYDDAAYGLAAAHALIRAGHSDAAAQRAQVLRQRRPTLTLAYTLESHALLERGQAEAAVACLLALPADAVRDQPHWVSLGVALQRCHRHDDAIVAFMQALALKMDDPVVHFRLGMSFKDKGMKAEAAECVRTALLLGLGGSELAARAQLVFLEREACRWPGAAVELAKLRAAVQAAPDDRPGETGPFPHAVFVDDPLEQLKVARLYAQHVASRVAPLPLRKAKAHEGRLRIGYLSADFHQHATSQLMIQMLEAHDRSRYEVTLFSAGPDDGSAMRARIVATGDRFEQLRGQSHEAMARRIRELGIDILVDVKGATHGTLMPVTAHRAAPLQVSWLGFPGTTGAAYVDYFIGDPLATPLEHAAHFSEKIAQMPLCYQPNDARRALPQPSRRSDWGAPQGVPLLCAFHQSYKISEAVFDSWCRVLRAVPNAVLWLMRWNTNVQSALEAAARARGIAPERLCFAPMLPLDQHLSRLACADLYLDAWPCNAHTTAGEALWVGVPVVTILGETFAQRVATSLLHAVRLDELSCASVTDYERLVTTLAGDAQRRVSLREHLAQQRTASPLFDGVRFARGIEVLYDRMWARAVAGLPPEHLAAA